MFAAGRNSGALDFEAVEQATRDALHQAGASLIEMLLNDDAAYEPQQHCAWGGQARYAGKRAKKLVTMLGAIVVERPYDHCGHCGSGFAAREQAEIERAVQLELPAICGAEIPILYIEVDGTGVPVAAAETTGRKGKNGSPARTREVKLGCVFTQSGRDARGRPVRDEDSTTYSGAIEDTAAFGPRLFNEAWRRGWSRARRKVILGDGAAWIWNLAQQYFPGAIEIVDLYHAREHLWDLASKLFLQQQKRRGGWQRRLQKKLDAGRIEQLVATLRGTASDNLELQHQLALEAGYFERNAERMRYREFRRQGLFVGSGVIEAGCRTLIASRLKRSGMFWSVRGANAITALRCRLVQYKMSLKGRAIPIQDEPDGDPLGGQEQSSCGRWESPCSKPNR